MKRNTLQYIQESLLAFLSQFSNFFEQNFVEQATSAVDICLFSSQNYAMELFKFISVPYWNIL